MTTITLTLTCTEDERAGLIARFIQTAQAVTGEIDDGVPSDPNGSKVDVTGVVWDARYHGAQMTKNQDQTWRRKKGLSEQEKADADAYEAGCRGAPTQVAAVAAGIAPVVQAAPAVDIPAFLQAAPIAAPAPLMTMPGMPALAPVAPPPAPTYDELIAAFQATIARVGQSVVDTNLATIYTRAEVTDMKQLNDDPEVRRKIVTDLTALQPVAA